MKEEGIIFDLIRKDCERNGSMQEHKLYKMALLLNIHPETYQKVMNKLIENGKVEKDGHTFSIL